MQFKRLNQNEIRCILSEEELCRFGVSLDDIIEKNERTYKFFSELLKQAGQTLGILSLIHI